MADEQYVLVTVQGTEINAYSTPGVSRDQLEEAGHLLADGATPPMAFQVVPLQPAKWGSI